MQGNVWVGSKCETALAKMSKILVSAEVGFKKSETDQCLFVKTGKKRPVMFLSCVDDLCIFGNRGDMDEVTRAVRKHFPIKTEGCLKDFNHFVHCHQVKVSALPLVNW